MTRQRRESCSALYARVTVVGCGLVGSSIVRALSTTAAVGELIVAEANPLHRRQVAQLGLAKAVTADVRAAVADANLVILAVPVRSIAAVMADAASALPPGCTITDVGSVKRPVAETLMNLAPEYVHVVPGHPVSGGEGAGPLAGSATLFSGRWVILTPQSRGNAEYLEAVARLTALWRALGAKVEVMDAERHDAAMAITSHLPHLIAYSFMLLAGDGGDAADDRLRYSARGLRDFTRIAAANPVMWRDIFMSNGDRLLDALGEFRRELDRFTNAVRRADAEEIEALCTRARSLRLALTRSASEDCDVGESAMPQQWEQRGIDVDVMGRPVNVSAGEA